MSLSPEGTIELVKAVGAFQLAVQDQVLPSQMPTPVTADDFARLGLGEEFVDDNLQTNVADSDQVTLETATSLVCAFDSSLKGITADVALEEFVDMLPEELSADYADDLEDMGAPTIAAVLRCKL
jgi:hypothetical protein